MEAQNQESGWRWAWWWQPDQKHVFVQGFKRMKLDGLKEAVKPDIHVSKRVLWLAIFGCLLSYGGYLSKESADEYFMHSVHYTRHGTTRVGDVPFGAVTICPHFLFMKQQLDEAQQIQKRTKSGETINVTGQTWTNEHAQMLLRLIYSFCEAARSLFHKAGLHSKGVDVGQDIKEGFSSIKDNPNDIIIKNKIIPFLIEGSVNCSRIFLVCFWNGHKLETCDELFHPVQTDIGMCCVFNKVPDHVLRTSKGIRNLMQMQSAVRTNDAEDEAWRNWNIDKDPMLFPDNIFKNQQNDHIVPKRQRLAGRNNGLSVVVLSDKEPQACPVTNAKGLLVAVQNPSEEPQMLKSGFLVKQQRETFVKITSKLVKAKENMRKLAVDDRQCYFNNDHNLQDFTKYTEANCQSECQAFVINEDCKCIPWALSAGNGTYICGPEMESCVVEAKTRIQDMGYEKACKHLKCYPECNKLSYEEEISSSPYEDGLEDIVRDAFYVPNDKDFTTIHIFQKHDRIDTEEGKQTYDTAEVVGLIGGILGLTSGVTLMSIFNMIEGLLYIIFYYFLYIPWWRKWFERVFGPYISIKDKFKIKNLSTAQNVESGKITEIPTNPTPLENNSNQLFRQFPRDLVLNADSVSKNIQHHSTLPEETTPSKSPTPIPEQKKSRFGKHFKLWKMFGRRKSGGGSNESVPNQEMTGIPTHRSDSSATILTIIPPDTPPPPPTSSMWTDMVWEINPYPPLPQYSEIAGPSNSQTQKDLQPISSASSSILSQTPHSTSSSEEWSDHLEGFGYSPNKKSRHLTKYMKPWVILKRGGREKRNKPSELSVNSTPKTPSNSTNSGITFPPTNLRQRSSDHLPIEELANVIVEPGE